MSGKCCNNDECKNSSCNSIIFKNVEEIDEVNINNLYLKIMSFVKELNNIYGEKFNSIRLYDKLLKKTYEIAYENSIKDLSNEQKRIAINKQISVFLEFCKTNLEAISNNSFDFVTYEIKFSDKAYINLKEIMDNTITEEKEETILTILSYFNLFSFLLTDNEVFKNNINNNQPDENHESMFLEKFRKRIDENFKEQTFDDPLQATMSLFNSGLFGEMLESMKSDINEGKLSIPKLLGSVQGMVKQLNGDENSNSDEMPDLNNIMGNVSSMLGGLPVENLLGMMSGGMSNQEMPDMSEISNMINNLNIKK